MKSINGLDDSTVLVRYKVRKWASGQIHLADVVSGTTVHVDAMGGYTAILYPLAMLCGVTLRAGYDSTVGSTIVVMNPDQRVTCRACRRIAKA